jgi:hypothetical protein
MSYDGHVGWNSRVATVRSIAHNSLALRPVRDVPVDDRQALIEECGVRLTMLVL